LSFGTKRLVCDPQGRKTLSALYRHMVGNPCPKSAADTFREAPWQADDIRVPLREYLVKMAFELEDATNAPKRISVSIDDSLTVKDKGSHRLQAVDWHFDHTKLSETIRVFISRRHNGDTRPRFYASTDRSLSAQEALTWFRKRWSCEVANWHIAERLGWADCRLWRVESSEKFLMVPWLALGYLEYREATEQWHEDSADVIRTHRQEHAVRLLGEACSMVLQLGNVSAVLARYTFAPAPT
jgi:hypothetical protein